MRASVLAAVIIATLSSAAVSPAFAAMYRWVDSNGRVHYSDTMPPDQAGKGHRELDRKGRVVNEVEQVRTSEEDRRRAEAARRQAQEEERQALEQTRRDRALLTSYTSEEEIDLVRDRALELEKLQIDSLQAQMKNAKEKLDYANGEIKRLSGPGKKVPQTFVQMKEEAESDQARIGEMLGQRQNSLEDIRKKYESDKLRFRELKHRSPR